MYPWYALDKTLGEPPGCLHLFGTRKNLVIPCRKPNPPYCFLPAHWLGNILIIVLCLYFCIRITVCTVGVVRTPANERGCSLDRAYWSVQLGCCIQRLREVGGRGKLEVRIVDTKECSVKRDGLRMKHVQSRGKSVPHNNGPTRFFRHASPNAKCMHWPQQWGHSWCKFTSLLKRKMILTFEVCNIESIIL
jgi:hypothetical protein